MIFLNTVSVSDIAVLIGGLTMTLYYFAYGSNMLLKRICINTPSAQFKSTAELKKYTIGFTDFLQFWHGSPVTIVESEASSVWGVLWEISKEDEDHLDRQETNYKSIYVTVHSPTLGMVQCKCYHKPIEIGDYGIPSLIYKKIMVQGAKDHGLPEWYVNKLENIPDNGYKGKIDIDVGIDL